MSAHLMPEMIRHGDNLGLGPLHPGPGPGPVIDGETLLWHVIMLCWQQSSSSTRYNSVLDVAAGHQMVVSHATGTFFWRPDLENGEYLGPGAYLLFAGVQPLHHPTASCSSQVISKYFYTVQIFLCNTTAPHLRGSSPRQSPTWRVAAASSPGWRLPWWRWRGSGGCTLSGPGNKQLWRGR